MMRRRRLIFSESGALNLPKTVTSSHFSCLEAALLRLNVSFEPIITLTAEMCVFDFHLFKTSRPVQLIKALVCRETGRR